LNARDPERAGPRVCYARFDGVSEVEDQAKAIVEGRGLERRKLRKVVDQLVAIDG